MGRGPLHPRGSLRRRGFTLVEAVAAIVVIATLGSVATGIVYAGVEASRRSAERDQLLGEMSQAMDHLVTTIRAVPADADGTPGLDVTASSVVVDGAVTFALQSGSLVRTDAAGTSALLRGVTAFTPVAMDRDGTALAVGSPRPLVRRVELSITASRQGLTETLRTRVFLRNTASGGS